MNNCKKSKRKTWKNLLDDQTQEIIRQIIREKLVEKNATLGAMLQEVTKILPDFSYGRSTFAKIVHSMGFKFSKCEGLQEIFGDVGGSSNDSDFSFRAVTSVRSNSNSSSNGSANAPNDLDDFPVNLKIKCEYLKDEAETSANSSSLAGCSSAIEVEMQYEPAAEDFTDGLTISKADQIRADYRQILPRPAAGSLSVLPQLDQSLDYENSAFNNANILPQLDQSFVYENSAFKGANIVGYQQFPDGTYYPILKVPSNFVLPAVNRILMHTTMQ